MSEVFDLKARLQEMGITPKKSFGQNFLVSSVVIARILEAVKARRFLDLVEIGPGLGALTEPLLVAGFKPHLVELDRDMIEYWRGRGMQVTDADALQLDWTSLGLKHPALLVSNLPYQISTSLVIDRCLGPAALQYMVLMFQKEVAERLMAQPRTKEYGLLSVMAQLHFRMTKVVDASPRDFFPPPKVASRVLSFERMEPPQLEEHFLKFVKQAFAFRRKFMLKNLKGVVDKTVMERLPETFAACGLSDKARAEELSPAQFVQLYRAIYGHKDHSRK